MLEEGELAGRFSYSDMSGARMSTNFGLRKLLLTRQENQERVISSRHGGVWAMFRSTLSSSGSLSRSTPQAFFNWWNWHRL